MTQENSSKKWSANSEKTDTESTQSLGAFFQRERQKKQLTIKEVAEATRIPPESLEALEAGNRNLLPVSVFTRGFVKIYAAYLDLNQAEILERFSNEWGRVENTTPEILSGESMAETSPFFLSLRFYFFFILFALLISLAYFFFQADDTPLPAALRTVPLSSTEPAQQVVVKKNEVKQLEIISAAAQQDTLLISPQSAGKITLEEDAEPTPDGLKNNDMAESSEVPASQTIAAFQEQIKSELDDHALSTKNMTALPTPAPAPQEPVAQVQQPKPSLFQSVNLHIRFLKKTRISVAEDDGEPDKFIFTAGEESSWQAASHITLFVDDAEAVELTLNDTPVTINDTTDGPLAITLPTDLNH